MGKRTRKKFDEELKSKIRRLEKELRSRKNLPPGAPYYAPNVSQNEDPEYEPEYEEYDMVQHDVYTSGEDEEAPTDDQQDHIAPDNKSAELSADPPPPCVKPATLAAEAVATDDAIPSHILS